MNHTEISRKCALLRILALLLWLAVVLWLSLAPNPPSPPDALSWDKLRHAGAYALMTFLAGQVFILYFRTPRRGWVWAAIFAIAFGGLTEVAQGLLTNVRQAEFGDMLANACGAGISLTAAFAWLRFTKQRKP